MEIAGQTHRTSAAIENLTKLVRRQGLFDDPTDEINNLIFSIKEDLASLRTKCDTAQSHVDEQKRQLGERNQAANYGVQVVEQLRMEVMNKTKDFKSILEVRSSRMKTNQDRKVKLTGNAMLSPVRHISTMPNQQLDSSAAKFYNPYAMSDSRDAPGISDFQSSEQQMLLAPPTATMQYYESREQAINEVQKTIEELGQIFHRVASMITEQQSLVERLDEDVEAAVSNTELARNVLLKTYENVSSNRGLYTKLGAIFAIFVIFFILFLL